MKESNVNQILVKPTRNWKQMELVLIVLNTKRDKEMEKAVLQRSAMIDNS